MPLTAPSAEFAHEQVSSVVVQLALQPLGHDHSASGPAGLVSGAALPVISRSVAEPAASATTATAGDRPGALDRFAHRVLGSISSRGREGAGVELGSLQAVAGDPATIGDSAGAGLPSGIQAPASAAPAPDLPPLHVRVVPAIPGDAAGALSLVHATDVAVGARRDGRVGRPMEGTGAHDHDAGAATEPDARPDADPGLPASGPAPDGGPEWAIQRVASDAGRNGPPPVRLSVGQVRRLGLGAPLVSGAPNQASAPGSASFGSPLEDFKSAATGAAPHAPTTLRIPRVHRSTEGTGGHRPDDDFAGAEATDGWMRHTAVAGQVETGARAADGLAPRTDPSTAQSPRARASDAVVTAPVVVGVPVPAPSPNQRQGGNLPPLVGGRHLGRGPSGSTGISVSRLADAHAPSGGTSDGSPMAGPGFEGGASPAFAALPDVARWADPDAGPALFATTHSPSWPGVPGPDAGSARGGASAAQRGPSVFRASPGGPPPTAGAAAVQREWTPSGEELPLRSDRDSATSPVAAPVQRDPEPSHAHESPTSVTTGSFDADVVQRAMGGSTGSDVAGSLPTGDRELELLAESLYERVRSHLRLELLVDRERAGILSNLS
ncbi:MAG: hypothetical protein ACAH65_09650 [Chloroflexota bacterium]